MITDEGLDMVGGTVDHGNARRSDALRSTQEPGTVGAMAWRIVPSKHFLHVSSLIVGLRCRINTIAVN